MKKIASPHSQDCLSPLTQQGTSWLNWSYGAIALGSALSHLATTSPATAQSTPPDPVSPFDTSSSNALSSKYSGIGNIDDVDNDTTHPAVVAVSTETSSSKDPALTLKLSPSHSSTTVNPQPEPFSDRQREFSDEFDSPEEIVPDVDPPAPPHQGHIPNDTDTFLAPETVQQLDQLFAGGTDSLVAKAVGAAEGTRTPDGDKTWAYYGHTDPGNGVFNLGTFSYQHGASSPEEADQRQLPRLQKQARQIQQDAENRGLKLGLEEQLNAIDLANQAPEAALASGGYLDRLQEAYQMGLRGQEAILWARVRSYIDPNTQTWNAPGLGNNLATIEADQQRRMDAIAQAIIASRTSTPLDSYSLNPEPEPNPQPVPRSGTLEFLSSIF